MPSKQTASKVKAQSQAATPAAAPVAIAAPTPQAPEKKSFGAFFGAPEQNRFLEEGSLTRSRFLGY